MAGSKVPVGDGMGRIDMADIVLTLALGDVLGDLSWGSEVVGSQEGVVRLQCRGHRDIMCTCTC